MKGLKNIIACLLYLAMGFTWIAVIALPIEEGDPWYISALPFIAGGCCFIVAICYILDNWYGPCE